MSSATETVAWTYDDFTSDALDPARWKILEVVGPDGERHAYQDRNARLRTGDGHFELTVHPFSRFHDVDPLQNNAKQMYESVQRLTVPVGGHLRVDIRMAVRTHDQIPYNLLDAFGTVNLFDRETGVVFNVAATNDTVYAVVERLPVPGVTPDERFVHRVVLEVPTEPGQEHHYAIDYDAEASEATWFVDGQRAYWTRVPVPVTGFQAGMALFSARDLNRFTRAEREHGQGATGRWGPWHVSAHGVR
nr:DUF6081 family protein [Kibdelosporangium sp. MJ126-NF4]CEL13106.1 hypothetical protein [Kibdelosporangium sp. MJ126-NF4]CTQ98793.1 hypothetical protein [Kibdelosporangium sp. MJ126-NF4]